MSIIISHSGVKTRKVVSVDGREWGYALQAAGGWRIFQGLQDGKVVAFSAKFRGIEFAVRSVVESARMLHGFLAQPDKIRVSVLPQPLDSDFNKNMTEAERQQRLALAAPALLTALKDALRSCRKDFPAGPEGEAAFRAAYSEQFAAIALATGGAQ